MAGPSTIAKVWLFLLTEGGHWTSNVLCAELGLRQPALQSALNAMTTRGYAKRARDRRPFTYRVEADCRVPQGVTVDDLKRAGLQFWEHT